MSKEKLNFVKVTSDGLPGNLATVLEKVSEYETKAREAASAIRNSDAAAKARESLEEGVSKLAAEKGMYDPDTEVLQFSYRFGFAFAPKKKSSGSSGGISLK